MRFSRQADSGSRRQVHLDGALRGLLCAGIVALAGVACTTAAMAAHPKRGGQYAGTTSEHLPVSFSVSSNGKHIVKPVIDYGVGCPGGGGEAQFGPPYHHLTSKVSSNGAFSMREHYHQKFAGVTTTVTVVVHGRFVSAKSATGTTKFNSSSGKHDKCTSGKVKFTVTAG